jgi:protocatechuate 3,4-dioxygenase beta subunit
VILALLLFALLADEPTGSISGTVTNAVTGAPLANAQIFAGRFGAVTDAAGRYTLQHLPSRTHRISALPPFNGEAGFGTSATRFVTLADAQQLTAIDFKIPPPASLSGRVYDENKEPLPGFTVFLVAREYSVGALRYVFVGLAATDDQGRYRIGNIRPARAHTLVVQKRDRNLPALSDVPANPKFRKRAFAPTYYPGTTRLDGAQWLQLSPGETREAVDLQLSRAPNLCIEGRLETGLGPGAAQFQIEPQRPTSGHLSDSGFYVSAPTGTTGPDGRFRICNLSPGDYTLTSRAGSGPAAQMASTPVSLLDTDLTALRAYARPRLPLSIEVVCDAAPPESSVAAKLDLGLEPLGRGNYMEDQNFARISVPGSATLDAVYVGDYETRVHRLPPGLYVKQLTYAGANLFTEPLRLGSAPAGSTLRVALAHDGATLTVKVTDKDANPLPDTFVWILPAAATSDAALADLLVTGQTDQSGVYTSAPLAPGKYLLLAGATPLRKSPEDLARLLTRRAEAQQVDLAPGAAATFTLTIR